MEDLTFDIAREKNMSWIDVIKFYKPDATSTECEEIYEKMKYRAHRDAIQGRRDCVTQSMIFDNIKYVHFKNVL